MNDSVTTPADDAIKSGEVSEDEAGSTTEVEQISE